jgi:hypothetical protein
MRWGSCYAEWCRCFICKVRTHDCFKAYQNRDKILRITSLKYDCVQGNCTPPSFSLDPPRSTTTQCVITIREDFLEIVPENGQVWVSDLYVKLLGVEKEHSTLVGAHGGEVYLTNMVFVGDRDKARAIDVKGRKLYVASRSPLFSGVLHDSIVAVVRNYCSHPLAHACYLLCS